MLRPASLLPLILLASTLVVSAFAQELPLQSAIRRANLAEVERLVTAGADLNARDETGSTPLMTAAIAGNLPIMKVLLERHCKLDDRQSQTEATALEYSVLAGRMDLVQVLLDAGARTNLVYGEQQQTILHLAAAKKDNGTLAVLLRFNPALEALDRQGNTPLDDAVLHGQAANVALLLAHGASVARLHPDSGRGALHAACRQGSTAVISALVNAGADRTLQDRWGQTPLDLALDYKNQAAVSTLLSFAARYPDLRLDFGRAMQAAVVRGRPETAAVLLNSGWDVNTRTSEDSTYLNDAALHGQTRTAALLLDRGARIDARNQTGGTPLHDAALAGKPDTIDLLLKRGAFVDARETESGATPLMLAASLGRTAAVAFLLAHGADPALKDRAGHTAWMRAREQQASAAMRLLESANKQPAS